MAGSGVVFPTQAAWNLSKRLTFGEATNQRAELYAILLALEILEREAPGVAATVYTDSAYSIGCLTKWWPAWVKNGWRNAAGKPVMNQDIIKPILAALEGRSISFKHVKAHRNNEWNNQADLLARAASGL